jgi:hypothetical protein
VRSSFFRRWSCFAVSTFLLMTKTPRSTISVQSPRSAAWGISASACTTAKSNVWDVGYKPTASVRLESYPNQMSWGGWFSVLLCFPAVNVIPLCRLLKPSRHALFRR